MQGQYRNVIRMDPYNSNLYSIWTEPKFAIGQRAMLIRTPKGNVLWDCISYLDQQTIDSINELGGIHAIAISHPHFYSSHVEWAKAFNCEVYVSSEDEEWLNRRHEQQVIASDHMIDIFGDGDITIRKVGGHFPGSTVLYWRSAKKLLTSDTIMVVQSGLNPQPGQVSFSFMWSYPNMIPLGGDQIAKIWDAVKRLDFNTCHSSWWDRDVRGDARKKVFDSARIILSSLGSSATIMWPEEH